MSCSSFIGCWTMVTLWTSFCGWVRLKVHFLIMVSKPNLSLFFGYPMLALGPSCYVIHSSSCPNLDTRRVLEYSTLIEGICCSLLICSCAILTSSTSFWVELGSRLSISVTRIFFFWLFLFVGDKVKYFIHWHQEDAWNAKRKLAPLINFKEQRKSISHKYNVSWVAFSILYDFGLRILQFETI